MNNKFKKINIFNIIRFKIRALFDHDIEKNDPKPRKDWVLIVSVFFILVFCFTVFYYIKFLSIINADEMVGVLEGDEIKIENISKSNLEKTLKPWIDREIKFSEYLEERPSFDFLD